MTSVLGSRWDDEYEHGRYEGEPPLPFVQDILATLRAEDEMWRDVGLYVGCGNGRNYLPLVDAGANLRGLDVSAEAIKRLAARRPGEPLSLSVGDFRSYRSDRLFGYLVAIQVFQHGDEEGVSRYFANVTETLRPGGLFFLRVNSSATDVYERHVVTGRNRFGGFTVRYDEGPKRGLDVHFYSREELLARARDTFDLVMPPRQDVIHRSPPKTGSWAQWVVIWRRRRH